jgi:hypothetical protein
VSEPSPVAFAPRKREAAAAHLAPPYTVLFNGGLVELCTKGVVVRDGWMKGLISAGKPGVDSFDQDGLEDWVGVLVG